MWLGGHLVGVRELMLEHRCLCDPADGLSAEATCASIAAKGIKPRGGPWHLRPECAKTHSAHRAPLWQSWRIYEWKRGTRSETTDPVKTVTGSQLEKGRTIPSFAHAALHHTTRSAFAGLINTMACGGWVFQACHPFYLLAKLTPRKALGSCCVLPLPP